MSLVKDLSDLLMYEFYKILIKYGVYKPPTISNSGIGVHKIVVIDDNPNYTFKMNLLECEWYNKEDEVHKNVTI